MKYIIVWVASCHIQIRIHNLHSNGGKQHGSLPTLVLIIAAPSNHPSSPGGSFTNMMDEAQLNYSNHNSSIDCQFPRQTGFHP